MASRRACEDLIEKGEVKVNGQVVTTQGTLINPEKDIVFVNGKKVSMLCFKLVSMGNHPHDIIHSSSNTILGGGIKGSQAILFHGEQAQRLHLQ